MKIGIPKEIKNNESRVAITPGGARTLILHGHEVFVETYAGENSGFNDEQYLKAGVNILNTAAEVYQIAEMIMKVKEPIKSEYKLIKKNQLVFTYFHFASEKDLTLAMMESGAVCLAYENCRKS